MDFDINGGHVAAQVLVQLVTPGVSSLKRYKVKPFPSTSSFPNLALLAILRTATPGAAVTELPAAEVAVGCVPEPPVEQAVSARIRVTRALNSNRLLIL